ncbi:hypothetical protein FACS1894167_15430 [Synergistales bacterium]|nr:hypothetical protein FACS1894167_15430 [Synergistales bacterium]
MLAQLGLPGGAAPGSLAEWSFGADDNITTTEGGVLFPRVDIAKWKEEKAARDAAKKQRKTE